MIDWHRSYTPNQWAALKFKSDKKKQRLERDSNPWLPSTVAVLHQQSNQANGGHVTSSSVHSYMVKLQIW